MTDISDGTTTVVEADPAPVVKQSVLQEYGAGIFSLLFALLTALSTFQFIGGSFVNLLQLIPIVVTGFLTWIIPLGKGRWPGVFKTGLDILSIIAVVLLPVVQVTPWPWSFSTYVLIALAILKPSATELGIYIRQNQTRVLTLGS